MARRLIYAAAVIVVAVAGAAWWLQSRPAPTVQTPQATPGYETVDLRLGDQTIVLDVADTPAKQQLGLGQRADLPPNRGMIFTYDAPGDRCFWMKDMNFPIDIIWLNAEKQIIHIVRELKPETYPQSYCPPQPADDVVELHPGSADKYQLKLGDSLAL